MASDQFPHCQERPPAVATFLLASFLGLHLPSFPVEIKYMGRRRDIFGNVTLFSFLLGAVSAAKCQGKKYPSNLE
jgi:hypothetical protein